MGGLVVYSRMASSSMATRNLADFSHKESMSKILTALESESVDVHQKTIPTNSGTIPHTVPKF
jgi:hypothetical protein